MAKSVIATRNSDMFFLKPTVSDALDVFQTLKYLSDFKYRPQKPTAQRTQHMCQDLSWWRGLFTAPRKQQCVHVATCSQHTVFEHSKTSHSARLPVLTGGCGEHEVLFSTRVRGSAAHVCYLTYACTVVTAHASVCLWHSLKCTFT